MTNKIISNSFFFSILVTLFVTFIWFISFFTREDSINSIVVINICTLIVYYLSIKVLSKYGSRLTKSTFFTFVFVYSFLFMFTYVAYFYVQVGDLTIPNEKDTTYYHLIAKQGQDLSIIDYVKKLYKEFNWDDIATPLYVYILYHIKTSPLIVYFVNILLGVLSSSYLFKLSRLYLPKKESYLSSALFILSAYTLFFEYYLFKESLFILFCVLAVYNAQKYIIHNKNKYLIYFILFVLILSFFRVGTSIILLASYLIYYFIRTAKLNFFNILLFILLTIGFFIILWPLFVGTYGKLASENFLSNRIENVGLSQNILYPFSFFNAFFGPIPTFFAIQDKELSSYYYAGYLVRYFMSPFFVFSVINIIKNKLFTIYPLIIYYFLGSTIFSLALWGFDMRFLITHVFLYYTITFAGLYNMTKLTSKNKIFIYSFYFVLIFFFILYNLRF